MKVLEFVYCKDWEEFPEGCSPKILDKCWCRQAQEKTAIIINKKLYGYVPTWEEENLI